jgi:stage II sporulation protein R
MKKILLITVIVALALVLFVRPLLKDKASLQNNILRLHVVANSDSEEDQQQKLMVRDSIISYLQPKLEGLMDKTQVMNLIREELPKLKQVAQDTLNKIGSKLSVVVRLCREEFNTRFYDTFSLPAGIYDALRVEIGSASGQNWWCVVFPSLCLPAAGQDVVQTAAGAGMDPELGNTLTGGHEIRFFFLDWLGKIENFFTKS